MYMVKVPYIINQRGERELFSFQKVYRAAKAAGAPHQLAKEIARQIECRAVDGIKTADIFKEVRALLEQETPVAALRFSLKEAMRKLGPTGFHFEKYVACIFEKAGYEVKLNQFISGKCIKDYEIDFVATPSSPFPSRTGTVRVGVKIGECKYHNQAGRKVDLEVALANYARFLDIQQGRLLNQRRLGGLEVKSIIVTNTKFSSKAKKYSKCMGVELLGWREPPSRGLEYLIDTYQLYPITILPSLTRYLAERFAGKNLMLVKDIAGVEIDALSRHLGVAKTQLSRVTKEAETLLGS